MAFALLAVHLLRLLWPTSPAWAQALRFLAFGDSITLGVGDDESSPEGYPGRLQRWLRDLGYNATVANFGVGGETTAEGLSRIDSVLLTGGHYLLLMEGTNDISREIGIETIRFNLDQMARRADSAGMVPIHATVIPRVPWATTDANNVRTEALATSLRALAQLRGRSLADQFDLFQSLPNVFTSYYVNNPLDPVGHPNSAGYTEIAGLFLEILLPLLEGPRVEIIPPTTSLTAGTELTFGVNLFGTFSRLEWDFGDLGFATSTPPHPSSVRHLYLEPDIYQVTLRGTSSFGTTATDRVTLEVGGTSQLWSARSALLPAAIALQSGAATDVTSQLVLENFSSNPSLTEVMLFPDIRYDEPPPPRRIYLRPGSSTSLPEVLKGMFGLSAARGALLLMHLSPNSASLSQILAENQIRLASAGANSSFAEVEELSSTAWSSTSKRIQNVQLSPGSDLFLILGNLDLVGGYFSLEVRDGDDALVGKALFQVDPLQARWRSLRDLFRKLDGRPQPLRIVVQSSGPRFSAIGVLADPAGGGVFSYLGVP